MERYPPFAGPNDASVEAAEVQFELLRAMAPSRKIDLVEDANRTVRRLAFAGIELRFPGVPAGQRVRLLMDLLLGGELADRAYGPRPETPGR
jgi:hypothetical protein